MRIIVFSLLFAFVFADPEIKPSEKLADDVIETGPTSYKFSYSTGDEGPARIFREEQRNPDGSVVGKYGYIDPNGKLRIVQYTAGANGYSASGDVGPDSEVQREARYYQQSDPSVKEQEKAWHKMRSSKWGDWNPGQASPLTSWNSNNPNWNAEAGAPPPPPPTAQPYNQPQPSRSPESERQWDEKLQNQWENTNTNNWKNSQKYQNQKSVDWNTWNSQQNSWNKGSDGKSWTSSVQHQWQQAQKSSFSNRDGSPGQWSQNTPPPVPWQQPPRVDYPSSDWNQPQPNAPSAPWAQPPQPYSQPGDWQSRPDHSSGDLSQPQQPSPPSGQWAQPPHSQPDYSFRDQPRPPQPDGPSGSWAQPPQSSPQAGQWQSRPDYTAGEYSQPPQPNPPSIQWQQSPKADLATGQWPKAPQEGDNPLSGAPYTYFSIDHSGDKNTKPFKYQYSY